MIIFLYGHDTFRSREKLRELKERFRKEVDPDGASTNVIDGASAALSEVASAIGTPSLFVRKRLIVVENVFARKDKEFQPKLADYLKGKDNDEATVLVFWDERSGDDLKANKLYLFLAKQRFSQEFKPLSNTEATAWLRERAKAQGVALKPAAASALLVRYGSDLWRLDREMLKLAHHAAGERGTLVAGAEPVIDERTVELLCTGGLDETIFALTDAIGAKQKGRALELLEAELAGGSAAPYLLTMILRQIRILLQVRQALELGHTSRKMATDLKLHPFVIQKATGQVRQFTLPVLKRLFLSLVDIDRQMKSGERDFATAMATLVAEL